MEDFAYGHLWPLWPLNGTSLVKHFYLEGLEAILQCSVYISVNMQDLIWKHFAYGHLWPLWPLNGTSLVKHFYLEGLEAILQCSVYISKYAGSDLEAFCLWPLRAIMAIKQN